MASSSKSDVRAAALHDAGATVEDMKEQAEREIERVRGEVSAFTVAARAVNDLAAVVDKMTDGGEMSDEDRAIARRWIARAVGVVDNLRQRSEVASFIAQGKAQALTGAVSTLGKMHATADAAASALGSIPDDGDDPRRPSPPIKLLRKAEEAAPKKAKKKARAKKKAARKKA